MCDYCEIVSHEDSIDHRRWYKSIEKNSESVGEWHLFYRPWDGWHMSHNGTLIKISYCPMCGCSLTKIHETST